MRKFSKLLALLVVLLCAVGQIKLVQAKDAPLQILYLQRAPFSFDLNSQPHGLLVDIISDVSREQNIEIRFKYAESWLGSLKILKGNINACSLGAYKTQQRMLDYKYSEPLFEEAPYVVVANIKVTQAFSSSVSIDTLLTSEFVFGIQKGFSYGEYVDSKLAKKKSGLMPLSYVTHKGKMINERNVFSLINLGRVDYVLMNADEYYWNKKNALTDLTNITALTIQEELPRNKRYLMCSKGTSDLSLTQLNQGIQQLKSSNRYQEIIAKYK